MGESLDVRDRGVVRRGEVLGGEKIVLSGDVDDEGTGIQQLPAAVDTVGSTCKNKGGEGESGTAPVRHEQSPHVGRKNSRDGGVGNVNQPLSTWFEGTVDLERRTGGIPAGYIQAWRSDQTWSLSHSRSGDGEDGQRE